MIWPSGEYLTSQRIDLTFILRKSGVEITNLEVRLDGINITGPVDRCLREGVLPAGGMSYRCPGVPLSLLAAGRHDVTVTAILSDGNSVADTVQWEILETNEN